MFRKRALKRSNVTLWTRCYQHITFPAPLLAENQDDWHVSASGSKYSSDLLQLVAQQGCGPAKESCLPAYAQCSCDGIRLFFPHPDSTLNGSERYTRIPRVNLALVLILGFAWAFLGAVLVRDPLTLPDSVSHLMHVKPTESTLVVSLIATVLAVATSICLSIAVKEALRHRMWSPISLAQVNAGVALARGSHIMNQRHLLLTLGTLFVYGLIRLMVSSWTTLLTPTLVVWSLPASGSELDIGSQSFEALLQQELLQAGAAAIRGSSFEIIDVGGILSGIAAAGYSFGLPGIFTFNGAWYNVSTGGILPAAPSYTGTDAPTQQNNTGLAFAGGLVPTNLITSFPPNRRIKGIITNYTLYQQGLTANVTCTVYAQDTGTLQLNSTYIATPIAYPNGTTAYWLWAWNVTADCGENGISQQQYVTRSNSSTVPQTDSTGLVSSVVCPSPLNTANYSYDRFIVTSSGNWKYQFLPLTVCEIVPVITLSMVDYANGLMNATAVNSTTFEGGHQNLLKFLAAVVDYQARNTQGLATNSIGDSLYSIFVSTATSDLTNGNTTQILAELSQYWRGVIEFSGTFLRSGFSAYPNTIPQGAVVAINGNQNIVTMGWSKESPAYLYTVLPLTFIASLTFSAVVYSLVRAWKERRDNTQSTFDASNPLHLVMASAAGGMPSNTVQEKARDLEEGKAGTDATSGTSPALSSPRDLAVTEVPALAKLRGFDDEGLAMNELVYVQLQEEPGHHKKLVVVPRRE
ncbi:hypothetical protein F5I97DRAFT_1911081 [Phlebopus sp. FC_14]|nr:hypothetical protein F5I97DRAFT_1911081 [Phlebopus sp. FC_14]